MKLEIISEPDELTLTSDSALLTQLLINLALNAINALDEVESDAQSATRCIRIQASQAQPTYPIRISLQNNGPGIPAKYRQRIFQRGFTTRTTGHGQGLYIARLVASHLAGRLNLLPDAQLDDDMQVGFMLELVSDRRQHTTILPGDTDAKK